MVGAKEIAAMLGLSISTIGRALADDPRISAETKARVRKACDQMGYVGNLPARMMRGGSSNFIGLVLPDIRNDFYASIAQTLSECCDRNGFHVALSITSDNRETEYRHLRDLVGARVAGTIIVPTAAPRRDSVALLKRAPHVQMLRKLPGVGGAWFGIDDEAALYDAADHLLRLGHRRIAYIGVSDRRSTSMDRLRGVRRAYAAHRADAELLSVYLGPSNAEAGEQAFEQILNASPRTSAILSASVHVTHGVLRAIRSRNIDIPGEMSFVGFGDPEWYSWWGPGLTTVQLPVQSLATSCGLWFLDTLREGSEQALQADHQSTSAAQLVVRGSTGRR
ncbi:LacI family transcriptional regulator [Sphingobium sp. TB-6]|nr:MULTISPECIES: LacI family DNA-binding transcriptional regulator [Sphingomonadaceae]AMK25290.1 LacI family transcriptional regulator [Sphingobium sp. TKS]NML87946.1 LacI family transcriptional regulator [Sphingobium sp. TB-6]